MKKSKENAKGALTLQINWSSAKTKKTVSEVSKLATKNKGMSNGFAVDQITNFYLNLLKCNHMNKIEKLHSTY